MSGKSASPGFKAHSKKSCNGCILGKNLSTPCRTQGSVNSEDPIAANKIDPSLCGRDKIRSTVVKVKCPG